MNTFSAVVFVTLAACASAGLLGAPVAYAPAATYSSNSVRISQSARPVAYAAAPVAYAQPAYAAPVAHAVAAPVAVPAATYHSSAVRISQSARPVAYAAAPVAHAIAAPAYAAPVAHAVAAPIAGPAVATLGAHVGYGYTPALGALLG